MPSAVNDNFSCYEKLDHLHFGPLFSGDDAGFVQCSGARRDGNNRRNDRQTRRALSEAPQIQSIQSVVDITNRIL